MTCEKCGKKPEGYDLFPYCEKCGANFCDDCWTLFKATPAGVSCPGGGEHEQEPNEPED